MTDHYQLALFHRSLAEICRSEVPLGRAFRMLDADIRQGKLRDAVRAMAADLEAGVPLGEAYRKHGNVFPPLYAALIEAGVASGDLAGTLDEIGRIASLKAETASRVRRVLAYPLLVAGFVVFILWFLYSYVVPQFGVIFSQITDKQGQPMELPGLTRLVFSLPAMIPGTLFLAALVVVGLAYVRDPIDGVRASVGFWMRVPVLGRLRLNAAIATLTATMAACIRRGMPLDRALDLSAASAEGTSVRRAAEAMAASARGGSSLVDAARDAGLLPPSMLWLLGTAEKQGYSADALTEISGICRDRVVRELESYLSFVGPMAELFLGLVVATIILGLFYPILKLQSALM
jgi:type IV pilus assembly protein PilC